MIIIWQNLISNLGKRFPHLWHHSFALGLHWSFCSNMHDSQLSWTRSILHHWACMIFGNLQHLAARSLVHHSCHSHYMKHPLLLDILKFYCNFNVMPTKLIHMLSDMYWLSSSSLPTVQRDFPKSHLKVSSFLQHSTGSSGWSIPPSHLCSS